MKLTDKDLLEDAVQGAINIMEANGIDMISASVPLAIIKGAPTIEAIPVEWLKKMQQESLNENDRAMVGAIEAIFIEWFIYVNQLREKNRQKGQEAKA